MKTINQVAKLSGVSVRTLQYYDQIGLLKPNTRSDTDYRLYSDADLLKLQQILFLRELDFSLKEIRALTEDTKESGGSDLRLASKRQKELLSRATKRTDQIIKILERLENGATLNDCAKDIKKLSKETKIMSKTTKIFLLLICPLLLAASVFTFYWFTETSNNFATSQVDDPDTSSESDDLNSPTTPIFSVFFSDLIYFNIPTMNGMNCYALDIRDVSEAELPEAAPVVSRIDFSSSLKSSIKIESLYGLSSLDAMEYDQLIGYVISSYDEDDRMVRISFSADRKPLREIYAPENGVVSFINGHEFLLASYDQAQYIDGVYDLDHIISRQYADFVLNDLNYYVEAHGLSKNEFINLLKSLL